MAANINSIAWAMEEPWHGLGTRVDDLMTAEEAINKGNLNYEVALKDICLGEDAATPHLTGRKIEGYKATYCYLIDTMPSHHFVHFSHRFVLYVKIH
jgi:hypothetical protein